MTRNVRYEVREDVLVRVREGVGGGGMTVCGNGGVRGTGRIGASGRSGRSSGYRRAGKGNVGGG